MFGWRGNRHRPDRARTSSTGDGAGSKESYFGATGPLSGSVRPARPGDRVRICSQWAGDVQKDAFRSPGPTGGVPAGDRHLSRHGGAQSGRGALDLPAVGQVAGASPGAAAEPRGRPSSISVGSAAAFAERGHRRSRCEDLGKDGMSAEEPNAPEWPDPIHAKTSPGRRTRWINRSRNIPRARHRRAFTVPIGQPRYRATSAWVFPSM